MRNFTAFATTVAACAFSATLASAQAQEIPVELEAILAEMPQAQDISDVVLQDISRNGQVEALVKLDQCQEDFCNWLLFAEREDGWSAVGAGLSQDVFFEPTDGGGAVINSDDVIFAYSGGRSIYMYGHMLAGKHPTKGTQEELAWLAENTDYTETSEVRLEKFVADLNGDGSPERIFIIGGIYYLAGAAGNPYVIVDADDDIIIEGRSPDGPRIFPKSEGSGSIVVNPLPAGMQVFEIN